MPRPFLPEKELKQYVFSVREDELGHEQLMKVSQAFGERRAETERVSARVGMYFRAICAGKELLAKEIENLLILQYGIHPKKLVEGALRVIENNHNDRKAS